MSTELKELFVCGFTFYKDSPYKEYYRSDADYELSKQHLAKSNRDAKSQKATGAVKGHDNDAEFEYFKESIFGCDHRVTVDNKLKDIILGYGEIGK